MISWENIINLQQNRQEQIHLRSGKRFSGLLYKSATDCFGRKISPKNCKVELDLFSIVLAVVKTDKFDVWKSIPELDIGKHCVILVKVSSTTVSLETYPFSKSYLVAVHRISFAVLLHSSGFISSFFQLTYGLIYFFRAILTFSINFKVALTAKCNFFSTHQNYSKAENSVWWLNQMKF